MWFLLIVLAVWCGLVMGMSHLRGRIVRRMVAVVLPSAGVVLMFLFADRMLTGHRLMAATFGMLYLLKTSVGLWLPRETITDIPWMGRLLYMSFWPGMDPEVFQGTRTQREDAGTIFRVGYLWFAAGVLGMLLMAGAGRDLPFVLRSWIGLFLMLIVLHFGLADVFTALFKVFGWRVRRMFRDPLYSRSVRDFWSRRWNMPFVEMSRGFLYPLFSHLGGRYVAVIGVFLFSGILHELAISYPVGAGWGGPLVYFLVQGGLMLMETRFPSRGGRWGAIFWRAWTYVAVLVPLPLLFHTAFRREFVDAFYGLLHRVIMESPLEGVLGILLWGGVVGHVLVLVASVQVPFQFDWQRDLSTLTSMNRKLFWTYGGYVVGCILSFAVLTALFHEQIMDGKPAALGIAGMITVFWTVRIVLDWTWIGPDEWPDGPVFEIGHVLLTSLFLYFVLVYGGIVLRQWI